VENVDDLMAGEITLLRWRRNVTPEKRKDLRGFEDGWTDYWIEDWDVVKV
jgi:hypothetical protein